jgi:hypothetical protein
MSSWVYILLGLCLGIFLLVKELRRANRSWLAGRVIASLFAVVTLVGMAFQGVEKSRVVVDTQDSVVRRGVVAADWQRKLMAGERLQLRGRWVGPKAKVLLMGMGAVLDSATGPGEFVLGTTPAQHGRAVFTLAAVSGRDTLEREAIPVEVEQGRSLRVLLLAASPDFENTFLSNWLAGQGDAVASRTAMSKDKYQLGFANRAERSLDVLTPALLEGFDLVIADEGVLSPMVYRQVRERGLGLYVKLDSGDIVRAGMRTLVRDSAGKTVVGMVMEGAGKVVYSTANASFSLWMAGRRQEYAAYWSTILRQVARMGDTAAEWRWQPALSRVGAPVQAVIETASAMPTGLLGGDVVYLAEDAMLPFRWRGSYWPERAGWFDACMVGGDTTWGYVWPADAWKGIYPGGNTAGTKVVVGKAMSVNGWMYTIFLICIFFLWIERKVLKL